MVLLKNIVKIKVKIQSTINKETLPTIKKICSVNFCSKTINVQN